MDKVLTVGSVACLLLPCAFLMLCLAEDVPLNGSWDGPAFIMGWGFLFGTPLVAGAGIWACRAPSDKWSLRINQGVFALWLCVFVPGLFIHF